MMAGTFDPSRKFVRVSAHRDDGFVEFDFAIGEPEIFVELMLTEKAFAEFCSSNGVILLDGERSEAADSDWAWRLRDASRRGFKS